MWIASTALVQGCVLVSNDRDFDYVDGLQVENWTQLEEESPS